MSTATSPLLPATEKGSRLRSSRGWPRLDFRAVANGRHLIDDLHGIRAEWQERIRVRRDAAAWCMADLLLRHPVVNASLVATELGITAQNIYRSLRPLTDADVLIEFTDHKRNQLWRAPEVFGALDRFAARAGRHAHGSTYRY